METRKGKEDLVKPTWDDYYMAECFLAATRSIDESTKCGCVVVSSDFSPLSKGYNGPPRGCDDNAVPMTRPEKYSYFAHAEENAISNAARQGICLKDSTFYITGFPCARCFRSIKNVGAKKVIYGPNIAKMHMKGGSDSSDFEIVEFMNSDNQIELVEYAGDCTYVLNQAKRARFDLVTRGDKTIAERIAMTHNWQNWGQG